MQRKGCSPRKKFLCPPRGHYGKTSRREAETGLEEERKCRRGEKTKRGHLKTNVCRKEEETECCGWREGRQECWRGKEGTSNGRGSTMRVREKITTYFAEATGRIQGKPKWKSHETASSEWKYAKKEEETQRSRGSARSMIKEEEKIR